jgi:hypothetical protein
MDVVFSELEKARVVEKLRHARERIRATGAKCEGRKSLTERDPAILQQARRLARKSPRTGKARSLRQIAAELAALGYVTKAGKPLSASAVKKLARA